MASRPQDCYTNPAFCMQSECHKWRTSPAKRQSPVGAYDEQDFYEEMLVDDSGLVKCKKLVVVTSGAQHRYEEIPDEDPEGVVQGSTARNRYEYIPVPQEVAPSPPKRVVLKEGYALVRRNDRYEMLPLDSYRYSQRNGQSHQVTAMSPQAARRGNPIATQKLHELLSTPKKSAKPPVNFTPQKPLSPRRTPTHFATATQQQTPRAQQKLNYALATRQIPQDNKRHTAVIAPICSSPIQSVYSETTYSNKSESWMNLSMSKAPVQATLAVAALMMTLCGGVTSGLCLYMVSIMGRLYYLDFGIVAGFTCFLLGLLGFRSRNCRWLPNRNYISGN